MKYVLLCFLVFSLSSCAQNWDASNLLGEWKTSSWEVAQTGKEINAKMDFNFVNDKRYIIDYGTQTEKGKYWISGDYLHTVEDGQSEKKVKILSLSHNTFIFEMNRAGSIENVKLIRN